MPGERLSKCACEYKGYVGHAASTRYRGHACSLTLTHPCQAIDDDCVAAYHSCPSNGVSLQIDSEGIVIAVDRSQNDGCDWPEKYVGIQLRRAQRRKIR